MDFDDPFIWICVALGVAGGWSLLVFVEQVFGRIDRFVYNKIERAHSKRGWRFINLLWKILAAPFVAFYFFAIPFLGDFSYHYFSFYVYAFALGFLIRLPKFIRWVHASKDSVS